MALYGGHLQRPRDIIRHEKRFFWPRRPFKSYGTQEIPLLFTRRPARQAEGFPFYERFSGNRCHSEYDETLYEKTTDGYGKIKIRSFICSAPRI